MRSTWASSSTVSQLETARFQGGRLLARVLTVGSLTLATSTFGGLTLAPAASAQEPGAELDDATRNAAREMGREGAIAFREGDFARAQDLLHRAYDLVPAPTIALYEARSLVALGRLVEAAERYEIAKRTKLDDDASQAFIQSVEDAGVELGELRPRIPRLTIIIEGPEPGAELVVTLDGAIVPAPLLGVPRTVDPGQHLVEASHPGYASAKSKVSVIEGQASEVVLPLVFQESAPPVEAPPDESEGLSAHEALGYASLGVGVLGLGVGVVSGIVMNGHQSDLDAKCVDDVCPADSVDDLDAFRGARTVSFIGYGVGFVGLGAGVALLLSAPSGPLSLRAGHLVPWVSHDSAGVAGTF